MYEKMGIFIIFYWILFKIPKEIMYGIVGSISDKPQAEKENIAVGLVLLCYTIIVFIGTFGGVS